MVFSILRSATRWSSRLSWLALAWTFSDERLTKRGECFRKEDTFPDSDAQFGGRDSLKLHTCPYPRVTVFVKQQTSKQAGNNHIKRSSQFIDSYPLTKLRYLHLHCYFPKFSPLVSSSFAARTAMSRTCFHVTLAPSSHLSVPHRSVSAYFLNFPNWSASLNSSFSSTNRHSSLARRVLQRGRP